MDNRYLLNRRTIFIILFAILLLGVTIYLWNVFLPFFTGLLIAYLLEPVVKLLANNKYFQLSRSKGVSLIFILFIALFVTFSIVLFNSLKPEALKPLIENIPEYAKNIDNEYHGILKRLEISGLPIDADEIRKKVFEEAEIFFKQFLSSLKDIFKSLFASMLFLLLVPLSTFYFLMDKDKILNTLKKYVKDEKEEQFKEIFNEIDVKIGGYLKGQLLTSLLVAVTVTITLYIFGIPYQILLGVIAGIANLIPYFGPLIGAASPILIGIANFSSTKIIMLILFFVILNGVVGFYINPKITSKTVNIHPLIVIIAIFVGNALFGIIGMLLAVPVAIIIKVLLVLVFKNYIKEI